jgi:RNA polymerase sigma-70 factor (ECF subfamily)
VNSAERSKQFMMQFARHEHDLFRYVLTLLPNWNDAQDVMQETAAALWQKFDQYDPGRPFLPWACQFAYHQVLNFRSRQKTRRRMFSDLVVESLAIEWPELSRAISAQREALDSCLGKLREADRRLLQERYCAETEIADLATQIGQTPNVLYKSLQRIRRTLLECVTRTLATEG